MLLCLLPRFPCPTMSPHCPDEVKYQVVDDVVKHFESAKAKGEKVVDADLDDYKEKHGKEHPGILRAKGHLGLQEHGGRVEFRNLYIKEL